MLNYIRETRAVNEGLHNICLEIPESIYLTFYEDVRDEYGQDILNQYLNYHQDDARPGNIKIKHDKDNHTIFIFANLHYLGNQKTQQKWYTDDYIDE